MWIFLRGPSRIVATFVVAAALMAASFLFYPPFMRTLQEWGSDWANAAQSPTWLDAQQQVLFNAIVTDTTFVGLMLTIIARAIVDVCFWCASLMGGDRY